MVSFPRKRGHYDGRVFLEKLLFKVQIHLIYFTPSLLLSDPTTYVTKLHKLREHHHCFPSDHKRACETIVNIGKYFEPLKEDELKYEVTILESFIQ
jgi:hypothetical protein